jgi:hypothetical protein
MAAGYRRNMLVLSFEADLSVADKMGLGFAD